MPARGYEFYLLVTLEDKIRIHARACNILYIQVHWNYQQVFLATPGWPGPKQKTFSSSILLSWKNRIPANCPDLIGIVPIFEHHLTGSKSSGPEKSEVESHGGRPML